MGRAHPERQTDNRCPTDGRKMTYLGRRMAGCVRPVARPVPRLSGYRTGKRSPPIGPITKRTEFAGRCYGRIRYNEKREQRPDATERVPPTPAAFRESRRDATERVPPTAATAAGEGGRGAKEEVRRAKERRRRRRRPQAKAPAFDFPSALGYTCPGGPKAVNERRIPPYLLKDRRWV